MTLKRNISQQNGRQGLIGVIVLAAILCCAVVLGTAAALPSDILSINDKCEVSGPIQKLKSIVQGKGYWVGQLQLLDQEIIQLETQPDMIRAAQEKINSTTSEVLEKNRQSMEELFLKHPQLRPSEGQIVASELRKQANAIEHAEFMVKLEQLLFQRAATLKLCRPIILDATQ